MPIGYIVGKQYKLDYNYDRYSRLSVWSLILRQASLRGYSVNVRYSHLGRNYSAEVSEMSELKGHFYLFSRALKHESNPMSAMIAALIAAGVTDAFMQALYLEGELETLRIAWADAVEREAQQAARINQALDALRDAIRPLQPFTVPLSAEPSDVAAAQWEDIQAGRTEYPRPLPAAPDEDDDL